jgi:Bacterial Ig-like domain (group 3)
MKIFKFLNFESGLRYFRGALVAVMLTSVGLLALSSPSGAVGSDSTTITLTNSLGGSTTTVGTSITFTATFDQAATGTVSFTTSASQTLCAAQTISGTSPYKATCTASFNAVGSSVTVTANYGGDTTYAATSAVSSAFTVSKGTPTVVISDSVSGSAPTFTPVTFTATVHDAGVTPTGTVTFYRGASTYGSCIGRTLSSGVATCTMTFVGTTIGSIPISASYSGDTNYLSLLNTDNTYVTPDSFTATQPIPTVTVTSSAGNSGRSGSTVAFTATVAGPLNLPTPTGTVVFFKNSTQITSCGSGGAVSLSAGKATCSVTFSSLGGSTYYIQAAYLGDLNYQAVSYSSSAQALYSLVSYTPSVVVTNNVSNVVQIGSPALFIATVHGAAPTPSGTVTFYLNGVPATACGDNGTVTLTNGIASCSLTFSSVSSTPYSIQASYAGDSYYAYVPYTSSTGSTVTIGKVVPSVVVTDASSHLGATTGTSTFTATVSGNSGVATGTVAFYVSGIKVSTCQSVVLSAGTATCSTVISSTTGNPYTVQASYSGDSNYGPVVYTLSTPDTFTVKTSPSLVLSDNVLKVAAVNVPIVLTAQLIGGVSTASGTINFYQSGVAISTCTNVIVTATMAHCQLTFTTSSVSPISIQASYSGDGNNAAISSSPTSVDAISVVAMPSPVTINFSNGSKALTQASKRSLKALVNRLQSDAVVRVYGYANGNITLARARTTAVRLFLANYIHVHAFVTLVTKTKASSAKIVTISQ